MNLHEARIAYPSHPLLKTWMEKGRSVALAEYFLPTVSGRRTENSAPRSSWQGEISAENPHVRLRIFYDQRRDIETTRSHLEVLLFTPSLRFSASPNDVWGAPSFHLSVETSAPKLWEVLVGEKISAENPGAERMYLSIDASMYLCICVSM